MNIPWNLNMLWDMNMSGFLICYGYTRLWICMSMLLNNAQICLNIPEQGIISTHIIYVYNYNSYIIPWPETEPKMTVHAK